MSILRYLVFMTFCFVSSVSCAGGRAPVGVQPQQNAAWVNTMARRQPVYHVPTAQELAQQKIMQNDEEAQRLNRLLVTLDLEMQVMELMQSMKELKDKESKAAKKKQETFVGQLAKKVEAAGMEVVYTITKWGAICLVLKVAGSYVGKEAAKVAAKVAVGGLEGAMNIADAAGEAVIEAAQESTVRPLTGLGYVLYPFWRGLSFLLISQPA